MNKLFFNLGSQWVDRLTDEVQVGQVGYVSNIILPLKLNVKTGHHLLLKENF